MVQSLHGHGRKALPISKPTGGKVQHKYSCVPARRGCLPNVRLSGPESSRRVGWRCLYSNEAWLRVHMPQLKNPFPHFELHFRVGDRGFHFHTGRYEFDMDDNVIFCLVLWWKSPQPVRVWGLTYNDWPDGSRQIQFRTQHNGKRGGWMMRAPLVRLYHD